MYIYMGFNIEYRFVHYPLPSCTTIAMPYTYYIYILIQHLPLRYHYRFRSRIVNVYRSIPSTFHFPFRSVCGSDFPPILLPLLFSFPCHLHLNTLTAASHARTLVSTINRERIEVRPAMPCHSIPLSHFHRLTFHRLTNVRWSFHQLSSPPFSASRFDHVMTNTEQILTDPSIRFRDFSFVLPIPVIDPYSSYSCPWLFGNHREQKRYAPVQLWIQQGNVSNV